MFCGVFRFYCANNNPLPVGDLENTVSSESVEFLEEVAGNHAVMLNDGLVDTRSRVALALSQGGYGEMHLCEGGG